MEIVTVNYNTPDLLLRLIKSIRKFSDVPIRVIDGSTTEFKIPAIDVCIAADVDIECFNYNIHHGRGLDYALETSRYNHVLCVDSEVQLLKGIMECFKADKPLEGLPCMVDSNGMNNPIGGILYLHPELLMVDVKWYRNQEFKFIHHGAPAIQLMAETGNEQKRCLPETARNYYIRGGRGTVERFGYNF